MRGPRKRPSGCAQVQFQVKCVGIRVWNAQPGTPVGHRAAYLHCLRHPGRGLHSSTFQLNLSALLGIGGARMGCLARVKGVLEGV